MATTSPRLLFGKDSICPRCRKVDRRGRAYGSGMFTTTLAYAQSMGWRIVKQWGSAGPDTPVEVECPICGGSGLIQKEYEDGEASTG